MRCHCITSIWGYTAPSSGGVPAGRRGVPAVAARGCGRRERRTGESSPASRSCELAPSGSLALTGELPPVYACQVKSGLQVTIYDEEDRHPRHRDGVRSGNGDNHRADRLQWVDIGGSSSLGELPGTSASSAGLRVCRVERLGEFLVARRRSSR